MHLKQVMILKRPVREGNATIRSFDAENHFPDIDLQSWSDELMNYCLLLNERQQKLAVKYPLRSRMTNNPIEIEGKTTMVDLETVISKVNHAIELFAPIDNIGFWKKAYKETLRECDLASPYSVADASLRFCARMIPIGGSYVSLTPIPWYKK